MHLKSLGKKLVVVLATAVAMTGGMPSAQAAGGSVCSVTGNQYDSVSSVYDLHCSGTADTGGTWHLQESNGIISGTGPNGETVTGEVNTVWPICVSLTPFTYCKSITLTVCIDGWWCVSKTVTVCIIYPGPGVTVCIEGSYSGPFTGNGEMHGTDLA